MSSNGRSLSRYGIPASPTASASENANISNAAQSTQSSTLISSASTASESGPATPPRLRRSLRRPPPPRPSEVRGRSTPHTAILNPEADDFAPAARMPPKRKASSSARSGKFSLSAPRDGAPRSGSSEAPIIKASDVFGTRSTSTPSAPTAAKPSDPTTLFVPDDDETDDEDRLFAMEMELANYHAHSHQQRQQQQAAQTDPGQPASLLQKSMNWLFNSSREKKKTAIVEPCDSHSAILYSGSSNVGEMPDDSARISFLPLYPITAGSRWGWGSGDAVATGMGIGQDSNLTIMTDHKERIDTAVAGSTIYPTTATWPADQLPVELFDLITDHLARDAVKSMRLVNKEFEKKVSRNLFHTSVVPFNTELYDMIEEDTKTVNRNSRPFQRPKGKGRATEESAGLHWQNAKDDAEGKVYKGHGLRVFQGFGPHIKRFGMSFDVLEDQLSRPPIKRELDHVHSYFGSYDWPLEQYTRFAGLAGLEQTADETLRMKAAFTNLHKVHELALSVDSGLGWLNGPDKSIYARIFQRQASIFGTSRAVEDRQSQEASALWEAIQNCHRSLGLPGDRKEVSLARRPLPQGIHPSDLPGIKGTRYADTRLWSSISASKAAPTIYAHGATEDTQFGVLYTTFSQLDSANYYDKSALVPADLRKEQKEWLLETEWAQRAFLECYMLAVIDNADKFCMVKTLKISKMSSGFLPLLARDSFWDALPNLTDVTLLVKPDWRSVEKDDAGIAETCPQHPSAAVFTFYDILQDRICLRQSVTSLNVGWASGGEHADGIFARNNHILPAPLTKTGHALAINPVCLVFPFIEHLTLTNCWISPPVLQELVSNHAEKALKSLTLDSVSLTAHPRFANGNLQQQQIAQAMAAALQGAAQAQNPPQQGLGQVQAPPMLPPIAQLVPGLPPGPGNLQNQPFGLQLLQQQIVHQQNALQAQHMNHMLGLPLPAFGQINPNFGMPNPIPPVAQPNVQATNTTHWTAPHREGSWAQILDTISPGPTVSSYLPNPPPWEEQPAARPTTPLQSITLISCGYVKLPHASTAFDQLVIETGAGGEYQLSLWFRARQSALSRAMLSCNDRFLGKIVQGMARRELNTLQFAWGLREGWEDEGAAEEVEYDGLLKGGSGRISGKVWRGMELVGERVGAESV
ncbi:unnamed protein product [Zymoseptoria tritici ST99CH_1A5]|uniref:F-box domain-containing protein n=1 Tax=Zymoseptoria tritici ST99CH_1A5 TaxID=1276529 RepID=A0A1Y6LD23_ZYMTR|nr:unnamed protein product [Zymoseptoria tritici ST99CH_1A5]